MKIKITHPKGASARLKALAETNAKTLAKKFAVKKKGK